MSAGESTKTLQSMDRKRLDTVEKSILEHVRECNKRNEERLEMERDEADRRVQEVRNNTWKVVGFVLGGVGLLACGIAAVVLNTAHAADEDGHEAITVLRQRWNHMDNRVNMMKGNQVWLVDQITEMVEADIHERKPKIIPHQVGAYDHSQ